MNWKDKYDIFIAGGSEHFQMLAKSLPKLYPYGTVHLASIVLKESQIEALSPYFDVLHQPNHHENGYRNFELFCIRDLNRLATKPRFIKLDADTTVANDWIEYVECAVAERPELVLFGNREGLRLCASLEGPLVSAWLGREKIEAHGLKVCGGFYCCDTAFYKQHDELMQKVHAIMYKFKAGSRIHDEPSAEELGLPHPLVSANGLANRSAEDGTRSLATHIAGGADRMAAIPSGSRIGQERIIHHH